MKDESGIVTAVDTIDYSIGNYLNSNSMGAGGAVGASGTVGTYANSSTYTVTPSTVGVGSSWYTIPNSISWNTTASPATSINSPLVIEYGGTRIDVGQAITMLMERLCIIQPSFELHEKYPALKEAYEAYKSLEALCKSGEKDE